MTKAKNTLRSMVTGLLAVLMAVSVIFVVGTPVDVYARTLENAHVVDVIGPHSRVSSRETLVELGNSTPMSLDMVRNAARYPFNYEGGVVLTHAFDFHDAIVETHQNHQHLVISLHHFPFDSVVVEVYFWQNGQWNYMLAQPIVTAARGTTGHGQTFRLSGNLPAGFYRISVYAHPSLFTRSNHFSLSVNFTNSLVTNFACQTTFHQYIPRGFNAAVTNQNVRTFAQGQNWRVEVDIVQARMSRVTGEWYFVLMRNNTSFTVRTQAEAQAEANQIMAGAAGGHFAWRMFGANPHIRHTETRAW